MRQPYQSSSTPGENVHYLDFDEPLFRVSTAYHLLCEMVESVNKHDESRATALSGISLLLSDGYEQLHELQARMQAQAKGAKKEKR